MAPGPRHSHEYLQNQIDKLLKRVEKLEDDKKTIHTMLSEMLVLCGRCRAMHTFRGPTRGNRRARHT